MANKNLTLTQVADVCAMINYTISMEGEDIAKEDLYKVASDLRSSLAAVLAKVEETEG